MSAITMHADSHARRIERCVTDATPTPIGCTASVSGSEVLVHLSSAALAAAGLGADITVGTYLGIRTRYSLVIGVACEIDGRNAPDGTDSSPVVGRVDLLGEIIADSSGAERFHRGVSSYPLIGDSVFRLGARELLMIFGAGGANTIHIGHLQQDHSIHVCVDVEEMVQKHFAVFGSTGAGKSSGIALILREILEAQLDLRTLLIDPHNEYGRSFEDKAHVVRPDNLRLPFWLFNFDEIVEVIFGRRLDVAEEIALFAELIPLAKSEFVRSLSGDHSSYRLVEPDGGKYTVDTPVPYRMEDLVALADSRMGKLENRAVAVAYQRLIGRLNTARKNPRYAFIFDDDGLADDSMVDILCQLLRLESYDRPMTIVQLAGFPAEVFDAIVSVLTRLAFEFGVWSDGAIPLLVVCEEAHRYANADRTVGFHPAREALSRIAKEGRKYGVFLGLVTQRAAQIDATLVSQCSTVFAMRMGNESDQRIVRAAVGDQADRLLQFPPSLGTREALAFGAGVPIATRLRFKELAERFIPRSESVWSRRVDPSAAIDRNLIASIVARWRGTAISNKPTPSARNC